METYPADSITFPNGDLEMYKKLETSNVLKKYYPIHM
jgi:hypothetical protein